MAGSQLNSISLATLQTEYLSPLGWIQLSSDGFALTGLQFIDNKILFSNSPISPCLELTREWLDDFFRGICPHANPALHLTGTPFQRSVWKAVQHLPPGTTVTYGELVQQLNLPPGAARAVGQALAHNPILLIVPCHRVVGSKGRLGGYAGGLWRKKKLLDLYN